MELFQSVFFKLRLELAFLEETAVENMPQAKAEGDDGQCVPWLHPLTRAFVVYISLSYV